MLFGILMRCKEETTCLILSLTHGTSQCNHCRKESMPGAVGTWRAVEMLKREEENGPIHTYLSCNLLHYPCLPQGSLQENPHWVFLLPKDLAGYDFNEFSHH